MENYIDITKLKRGTIILLETTTTVYEIVVRGPKQGLVDIQGSLRFVRPTKARIKGSIDCLNGIETKTLAFSIEKNRCLHILYGDTEQHDFITDAIKSASITGSDKSWSYDAIEHNKPSEPVKEKTKEKTKDHRKDEPPDDQTIDYSP
jgi:hypothetical protein